MQTAALVATFDLFDVSDLDAILQVSEQAGRVVAVVVDDETATRELGHTPVVPLAARMELVGAMRGIDQVISLPEAAAFLQDDQVTVYGKVGGCPLLPEVDTWVVPRVETSSPVLLAHRDGTAAASASRALL